MSFTGIFNENDVIGSSLRNRLIKEINSKLFPCTTTVNQSEFPGKSSAY